MKRDAEVVLLGVGSCDAPCIYGVLGPWLGSGLAY